MEPQKRVALDQVYIDMHTTGIPTSILEQIQQGVYRQWSGVKKALRDAPLEADRAAHLGDQGTRDRDDARRLLPALDALRLSPNLVVLGDPGGGKSTFARYVIARLIDGAVLPGVPSDLLPIMVVLRDVAQRRNIWVTLILTRCPRTNTLTRWPMPHATRCLMT